jgi:cobalt-zinc-cadmium resistance protein CzcA
MFDAIIAYSVRNKLVVGLFVLALIIWAIFSLRQIPIDAVPDITNNQVQVITSSPTLATQEVEQFITTPIELALQNVQDLVEIRSISRFGLSVVTVVFEERTDTYLARQLVSEHLREASENIPDGLGTPVMAPISTGLGEIYQYVIRPEEGYEGRYSATDLRTIQDWIVRRQLSGIPGVVEVNTMGGYLKQYEVAIDPDRLKSMGVTIGEVFTALENSNENTGGAYIEKGPRTYYIRTDGIVQSLEDVRKIVVDVRAGRPILIEDVATVQFGRAPRYGALVRNGEEAVGGRVMMLKGANSAAVTERVRERVEQIQESLPEGVTIEPYLVRDKLVSTAIGTVRTNLIEGALIVIFILVLLLGNWRASLIVASVIPLALLFAISMMNLLGISANLMSLGAIDFGLIVDGAVIIVESIVHRLGHRSAGQQLTQEQMDAEVTKSAIKIRSSAAFGEIIILIVYIPILALVGIEGKMFRPMAQTVMLAIGGALILSLTYVPMMAALVLSKRVTNKRTLSARIMAFFHRLYAPLLQAALRFKAAFVLATVVLFAVSFWVFSRMGGEFIPTLDEGDLAMQQILPPGTSLSQSIEMTKMVQTKILADFPEVREIVTNIGAAEIPTDPMPVEIGDYTLVMAPKDEWTTAPDREGMFAALEETMEVFPGVGLEFSQPIQLRFNELMTGAKADIAIKLYGADLEQAYELAKEAEAVIRTLPGAGTVNVEHTVGMPQVVVDFNYSKMAQYGLQVEDVNRVVGAAFAGAAAGTVYEGERRFDLTIRLGEQARSDISSIANLYVPLPNGSQVPLREVAEVRLVDAPMQISRENTNRRIVIGVNVGDSDVETLVGNIRAALNEQIELPAGYYFTYGGQFENLQAASARLSIAVPLALALIFILLFFTFGSFSQAALIFVAIPLSAIGGIWALELRGMPFSISAGIGFIALFGVAVLNGIVLIGYFNQLKVECLDNVRDRIIEGTRVRLRPVIMTASVASLGFLPMAISTSGGAEVQRPLATVVIGGLITATFLTLVILPILYSWLEGWKWRRSGKTGLLAILPLLLLPDWAGAQVQSFSVEQAIEAAVQTNPAVTASGSRLERLRQLQNLPYTPGRTSVSYQGEGLFGNVGEEMNQLRVVQNFPAPSATRALNRRQDALLALGTTDDALVRAELRLTVRRLYYSAQVAAARTAAYRELLDTYAEFLRIAEARLRTGETGRLEVAALTAEADRYRLELEREEITATNLGRQLAAYVGREPGTLDSLRLLPPPPPVDTDTSGGLFLERARAEVIRREAEVEVTRAGTAPTYQLGYGAQYFTEGGYASGLVAGVSLPLFGGVNRRRVEDSRLGVEVARREVAAARLVYDGELLTAGGELRRAATTVANYAGRLRDLHPEVIRLNRLNYRAGEVGYLQVLDALERYADDRLAYLMAVGNHNLAVARLRYLLNQR